MSKDTHIEWADSTLNLQMGCDGCELWNRAKGVKHCYAGTLTDRYGGRKGYPDKFEEPKLFTERLDVALKWPDLTGKERPGKPWLNGLPRMIFLNDMGDTFTESLPLDWLAPLLPRMADSPHVWMILTKRGGRMKAFSEQDPFPANVWPGVSVTTQKTMARVDRLLAVRGGGVKWISAEPLLGPVNVFPALYSNHDRAAMDNQYLSPLPGTAEAERFFSKVGLVIAGGESGPNSRPCDIGHIREIVQACKEAGTFCFVKQLGARVHDKYTRTNGIAMFLDDPKGGDPSEWPEDLRVRQIPQPEAVAG